MRERMGQMQEAMEQLVQYIQQLEIQLKVSERNPQISNALVKVTHQDLLMKSGMYGE